MKSIFSFSLSPTCRFLSVFASISTLMMSEVAHAQEVTKTETRFDANWNYNGERVWIGSEFWANPMEDWKVTSSGIVCLSGGARNVHLLTRQLSEKPKPFRMQVAIDRIAEGKQPGSAGFHFAIQDEIDDYRARVLRGSGLHAGVTSEGTLYLGKKQLPTNKQDWKQLLLMLEGKPAGKENSSYNLTFTVLFPPSFATLGELKLNNVPAEKLVGNVALEQNFAGAPSSEKKPRSRPNQRNAQNGPRFRFQSWIVSGEKFHVDENQKFGPILWAMHTLNRTSEKGYILRMTAQMPPIGKDDAQTVALQIPRPKSQKAPTEWKTIQEAKIDPLARTATFHIENWNGDQNVPYQLVYQYNDPLKRTATDHYRGVIRKDPTDRDVVLAGFTGNTDFGFPNNEIVHNVGHQNPDLLFFSGDQIYESVGGYGIVRLPVDRAVLNYLRKWYLFGWSFRNLMRDRVTICLPDDHDVYQGNIWGNGGNAVNGIKEHDMGGYAQHRDFVNAVHLTQTSHHPIPPNPRPIKQNISVFYSHLLYGRISFAIIADRMFKSGPRPIATWKGRPDHVKDKNFDTSTLDRPGLKLLGERQLKFLNDWSQNWWNADQKCVLSQTIFCNLANYHGAKQEFIIADLDSNGWPQTGRNKALRAMRKGFALHVAGDQHLASIVHHGIDDYRDAGFSFCVPSIAAGYPRSWRPDAEGRPVRNRDPHDPPNTGDYLDGFGNHITVHAVGNPAKKNRPGRINTLHDKASGHGIVRFHKHQQSATLECYRLQIRAKNPKPEDQFPGWPRTIDLLQNHERKAMFHLPMIEVSGLLRPYLRIDHEESGEHVYSLRIQGGTFQPKVFQRGTYRITVGSAEDESKRKVFNNVKSKKNNKTNLEVKFE